MGPILIFDKSALQSFGIEESVWLDNYFLSNITPLFYVETLADLSLPNPPKPPEQIISELAAKTPKALPNVHHARLVLGNLRGIPVETDHGRPIVDHGVTKRAPDGKIGVHFDESPESKALSRWHKREYKEVEREFAQRWRQTLDVLSFDSAIGVVKNIVPTGEKLSSLEQIKSFVDKFIQGNSIELLYLALDFLGIDTQHRPEIIGRWQKQGEPEFNLFAPYAAYVFSIDLLFYLAASKGIIAKERTSNKVDLAYLYYLPFCHVFVSGDKLHAKTASLFLRNDQSFIAANHFKDGLSKINQHYSQFRSEINKVGVISYAPYPPLEIETSIHKLWDCHCPSWRISASKKKKTADLPSLKSDSTLLKHLNEVQHKSKNVNQNILKNMDEADYVTVSHMVPAQRGGWRTLPEGIENDEINNKS